MTMKATAPDELAELTAKLRRIDELEKEVAPSGVSFAVRGQEDVTESHKVKPVADKLLAADIAIDVLETRKKILADLREQGLLAD